MRLAPDAEPLQRTTQEFHTPRTAKTNWPVDGPRHPRAVFAPPSAAWLCHGSMDAAVEQAMVRCGAPSRPSHANVGVHLIQPDDESAELRRKEGRKGGEAAAASTAVDKLSQASGKNQEMGITAAGIM